jgi:hypothetical protein
MPLHRQHEGVLARPGRQLHRLDEAVLGPGGGDEAVAEPADALVMGGRHVHRETGRAATGPQDRGEPAPGGEPHPMRPERAGRGPVPGLRREMLAQGPSPGHVEQLHSAADAEYRQPVGQRGGEQLQFRLITLGVDPARPRVRLRPIAGGVDVAAAGENEPVQPAQGARDAGHRGQQHGHTASLGDLVDVAGRQQRGRRVPASPLGRLGVRGQSDDGGKSHIGVT